MDFTYDWYVQLINTLKDNGYCFSNYLNYKRYNKTVILRHDVDFSLEKAREIAKLEHENNVKSTFFVLLSTNFYNIFSKESNEIIKELMSLGHHIGLHFDEKRYGISNKEELDYWIHRESQILSYALGKEVKVVSMHRPSKWVLQNNIQFKDIINSYSKEFFSNFKYLSDSRMHWRENVVEIIKSRSYNRLHILTHPFWYSDKSETIEQKLVDFITKAKEERYNNLKDNIRDLDELIDKGELIYENKNN